MVALRAVVPLISIAALLALAGCATDTDSGSASDGSSTADETTNPEPDTAEPTMPTDTGDALPEAADLPMEAGAYGRGLPEGVLEMPMDARSGAAWAAEDGFLYVFTIGSSSCPTLAEGEASVAEGGVVVTLVPPSTEGMCTTDMAATTTVVAVPDGVDATADRAGHPRGLRHLWQLRHRRAPAAQRCRGTRRRRGWR